jgi:hypothetical protein
MSIGHYGVAPAAKKASLRRAGSRDAVPGSVVAYFRLDRHRTGDDFAWNHPRNPVKLRVLSLFAQSFGGLPLVAYCWRNLFFCPPLKNRGLGGSPAAWRVTGCSTLSRIVPTSRCTRGGDEDRAGTLELLSGDDLGRSRFTSRRTPDLHAYNQAARSDREYRIASLHFAFANGMPGAIFGPPPPIVKALALTSLSI